MLVPAVLAGKHVAIAREGAAGDRHGGADESPRLSTSRTDSVDEIAVVAPLGERHARGGRPTLGASLIAVMAIVLVAVAVVAVPPLLSNTVQVTVRIGSAPKSVGLSLGVVNVTVSSTCWSAQPSPCRRG